MLKQETYFKYYKKAMLIPLLLIFLSIIILGNSYIQTGDIIKKDISLKGGMSATITLNQNVDINILEDQLKEELNTPDMRVRKLTELGSDKATGLIIETDNIDENDFKISLEKNLDIKLTDENYSFSITSSILGDSFYNQMIRAVLLTFILMAIVIGISYRTLIPSFAVVFAAFSNMLITLAVLSLSGITISIAGISALLLAIGYSVDTDVLLTTRIIKRKEGTIFERLINATKTGLTMTITTLLALTMSYFVSNSIILKEMFLVLLIGLTIDLTSTYLMNAGILVWYAKRNEN